MRSRNCVIVSVMRRAERLLLAIGETTRQPRMGGSRTPVHYALEERRRASSGPIYTMQLAECVIGVLILAASVEYSPLERRSDGWPLVLRHEYGVTTVPLHVTDEVQRDSVIYASAWLIQTAWADERKPRRQSVGQRRVDRTLRLALTSFASTASLVDWSSNA